LFFFSSRRRHTRSKRDGSSDVCSSDLIAAVDVVAPAKLDVVVDELRKLDADAIGLHGDMATVDGPARVVGDAIARFGGLDGVVKIGRASCREREEISAAVGAVRTTSTS